MLPNIAEKATICAENVPPVMTLVLTRDSQIIISMYVDAMADGVYNTKATRSNNISFTFGCGFFRYTRIDHRVLYLKDVRQNKMFQGKHQMLH